MTRKIMRIPLISLFSIRIRLFQYKRSPWRQIKFEPFLAMLFVQLIVYSEMLLTVINDQNLRIRYCHCLTEWDISGRYQKTVICNDFEGLKLKTNTDHRVRMPILIAVIVPIFNYFISLKILLWTNKIDHGSQNRQPAICQQLIIDKAPLTSAYFSSTVSSRGKSIHSMTEFVTLWSWDIRLWSKRSPAYHLCRAIPLVVVSFTASFEKCQYIWHRTNGKLRFYHPPRPGHDSQHEMVFSSERRLVTSQKIPAIDQSSSFFSLMIFIQ